MSETPFKIEFSAVFGESHFVFIVDVRLGFVCVVWVVGQALFLLVSCLFLFHVIAALFSLLLDFARVCRGFGVNLAFSFVG